MNASLCSCTFLRQVSVGWPRGTRNCWKKPPRLRAHALLAMDELWYLPTENIHHGESARRTLDVLLPVSQGTDSPGSRPKVTKRQSFHPTAPPGPNVWNIHQLPRADTLESAPTCNVPSSSQWTLGGLPGPCKQPLPTLPILVRIGFCLCSLTDMCSVSQLGSPATPIGFHSSLNLPEIRAPMLGATAYRIPCCQEC